MNKIAVFVVALLLAFAPPAHAQTGVRGDAAALAAVDALLQQVGGRAAWRQRVFAVEERGYLATGETALLWITRDFESGARLLERRVGAQTYREWVSPGGGWVSRNGQTETMPPEELAMELQGLRQEPYAVYHRLALNDSALRVALRDNGASLYVYDRGEQLLCWFRFAPNGVLRGWGNFYDGAINEHYYGPSADMGDANLPRWGVSVNGGWRFEYVSASLRSTPLAAPDPSASPPQAHSAGR